MTDEETLARIERAARVALETFPAPYNTERWRVCNTTTGTNADLLAIDVRHPANSELGFIVLEDCETTGGVLDRPVAEFIAAADPIQVLALVAEIRRLRSLTPR